MGNKEPMRQRQGKDDDDDEGWRRRRRKRGSRRAVPHDGGSKEIEMRLRHFVTLLSIPLSVTANLPGERAGRAPPLKSAISLECNFPAIRSTGFRFRFLFCASSAPVGPPESACQIANARARCGETRGGDRAAGFSSPGPSSLRSREKRARALAEINFCQLKVSGRAFPPSSL